MNDTTIESIIREVMPHYAKKILLSGTEEYSALMMVWEEDGVSGTTLIYLYDSEGEPINVYSLTEENIRRGVKVITQMRDATHNPMDRPTKVIIVE